MRLGVMGGTFDPIHFGHLFAAEEARVQFELDRVLFVPNGSPPHKTGMEITEAVRRFEMTALATVSNPLFECNDAEMHGQGPSYAVDTLTALKARWPEAELYYITGTDTVAEILTWRKHAEVMRLAAFIACSRPGFDADKMLDVLPPAYRDRVLRLNSSGLNISSTEIRTRLAAQLPVRYLLPDCVLEYIESHKLYGIGQ